MHLLRRQSCIAHALKLSGLPQGRVRSSLSSSCPHTEVLGIADEVTDGRYADDWQIRARRPSFGRSPRGSGDCSPVWVGALTKTLLWGLSPALRTLAGQASPGSRHAAKCRRLSSCWLTTASFWSFRSAVDADLGCGDAFGPCYIGPWPLFRLMLAASGRTMGSGEGGSRGASSETLLWRILLDSYRGRTSGLSPDRKSLAV